MTANQPEEYRALRATIRVRGTARVWLFLVGLMAWAALLIATTALASVPVAALVPLLVLAAAFEAVFALHVGVERIGRYLQAFHDDCWEQTSMAFGPALARTGSDPLFVVFFGLATLMNFVPVLLLGALRVELLVIGAAHLLFLVRLVVARSAAQRQRAQDLARFEQMRSISRSNRPKKDSNGRDL
jgi:hypothetical protein